MHRFATATVAILLSAPLQWAQDRAPISQPPTNESQEPTSSSQSQLITIPAGTRIPLSLIGSIHTKSARRGDVVHLETRYPVIVGYRDCDSCCDLRRRRNRQGDQERFRLSYCRIADALHPTELRKWL